MGRARKEVGEDGGPALDRLLRGIRRVLSGANGGRRLRTLWVEDARHMARLSGFSFLERVRTDAASHGIDLAGLDEGLDDSVFAVVIGANQRFVTLSRVGFSPHEWAYPDSWKLQNDDDETYLGSVPDRISGRNRVTKAMLAIDRDAGIVTFGALEARSDSFFMPWRETLVDFVDSTRDMKPGPARPEERHDPGLESVLDEASFHRRQAGFLRRCLLGAREVGQTMDAFRWVVGRWARRRSPDRVRFNLGQAALFASSGPPG